MDAQGLRELHKEGILGGLFFKLTAPDGREWVEDKEGNEIISPVELAGQYEEKINIPPLVFKGQFEMLMSDLEAEIVNAEGGWHIEEWAGKLQITQRESTNPRMSNNGGDYYFYKNYKPVGLGVEVWESWSCDIQPRTECGGQEYFYDCIISLEGLRRMAQLADVTIAARAWVNKEPESMRKLKQAIRSLGGEE